MVIIIPGLLLAVRSVAWFAQLSRKSYQKLFNTLFARKTSGVPCCKRTRGFALGSGTGSATFHVFSPGPASIVLALRFVAVPVNQTESCSWPPGIKAIDTSDGNKPLFHCHLSM